MRRFSILVLICLMAAFGLAACGGDDEGDNTTEATTPATTETTTAESAGGGGTIAVAADPGGALEFEQESLTAKPGNNTVELTNSSSTPHDVVIEDDGGEEIAKTEVITDGTDETTADLQDGEYTFYCSVPGHRQAGMEGKLTVK